MPQLGNDDFALAARRQATATGAYSGNRSRRKNLTQFATIAMVLLFTFIVRNILFTDYRSQQIETLRGGGKTQEEIDAIVPKTYDERRQTEVERKKSVVDMEKDVAFLLKEVQELRNMIVNQGGGGNGSGEQNMNANLGAKSAPWDSSATLGHETGGSIRDRQIVDSVSDN